MTGTYGNPIRTAERRMTPDFEERQFRVPGVHPASGLASLKHTMPHLRRSVAPTRLQGGGTVDPVGQAYAASRGTGNPDPMRRHILQALQFNARNPNFSAMPGSAADVVFPYAAGGEADEAIDPQDLMQPEDQQSEPDDEQRQVVVEAMAALEGQAEDPEEALARFIDIFGPRALKDLQQMVETKHRQQEQEDQGDEDGDEEDDQSAQPADEGGGDELAGASGGLLEGPGTGQSDEIEGTTPSGRPVLLSDGEYVFDAPTVAALGDGSTSAGARRLDELRRQIRRSAYGNDKQAKPMKNGGLTLRIR